MNKINLRINQFGSMNGIDMADEDIRMNGSSEETSQTERIGTMNHPSQMGLIATFIFTGTWSIALNGKRVATIRQTWPQRTEELTGIPGMPWSRGRSEWEMVGALNSSMPGTYTLGMGLSENDAILEAFKRLKA